MASGSPAHTNSGANGFDFATDDILCSYEDYGNQDSANGSNSDPAAGANSVKDFNRSRLSRPEMYAAYNQPEDSIHQDMTAIVDRSMKKHTENIMRFLEGLSSRLSQLELYCYNVDKSVGEMRHELTRDHSDAEIKLKSLDKHIQEVHRSVQVLRDKQELADTQKELAKLQLAQKESSSRSSLSSEDKSSAPASEPRKTEFQPNASNQQLALALPHQHQLAQQPLPPHNVPQQQTYYLQQTQIPNQSTATQIHYIAADPQGRTSQMQDMSRVGQQPQMNQMQNMSPYPQYQHQWSQQVSQPMQPPPQQQQQQLSVPPQPMQPPPQQQQQQLSVPPQMRTPSPPVYSPPQETLSSSSMPMQIQMHYSGVPPPVTTRVDSVPYGYSAHGRIVQQQQPIKGLFGQQPGDGYAAASTLAPSSGYVIYESERGRPFTQGMYPPPNGPFPTPQANPTSNPVRNNPQYVRNHPYSDLIDKMMNMGFRGDHVVTVIQRMEETGQAVDFNGVLDRLNGQVRTQRGWSG